VATGLDFLRKVPHRHAVPESDRAFVRFQVAQDKPEQGGLARSVWSNQPDPVRRLHMKRHATEQVRSPYDFLSWETESINNHFYSIFLTDSSL